MRIRYTRCDKVKVLSLFRFISLCIFRLKTENKEKVESSFGLQDCLVSVDASFRAVYWPFYSFGDDTSAGRRYFVIVGLSCCVFHWFAWVDNFIFVLFRDHFFIVFFRFFGVNYRRITVSLLFRLLHVAIAITMVIVKCKHQFVTNTRFIFFTFFFRSLLVFRSFVLGIISIIGQCHSFKLMVIKDTSKVSKWIVSIVFFISLHVRI